MTLKVIFRDGNTGSFGPLFSSEEVARVVTILAGRGDVIGIVLNDK